MNRSDLNLPALPALAALPLLLVLSSCQGLRDAPIVDMQGVNVAQYNRDLAACQQYAEQVAVGQDAARGAVAGAAVGGAVGAVVGNSTSAQRGAGVGAVAGGARGAARGVREQERVLRRCLSGRGYRVLN
ncbi:MAG: hypothetical protein ACE37N_14095 [Pseudohongiellaceae bacterium]